MNDLMIGISGVRGIVGESLTPELLTRFGAAFGTYVNGGKIVVGRDTRNTGPMVKHALFAGLLSAGCSVVDIGVVPTPTASIAVCELKAAGGVVISASHNPIEWNALKFFQPDGIYLDKEDAGKLLEIYERGEFKRAKWDSIKEVESDVNVDDFHIARVLKIVDKGLIRKRKFRVALDACNGAGTDITIRLLEEEFGAEVVKLNCVPDGMFAHKPEPLAANLRDLCEVCEREKVDIGFAQDPDADRAAFVSEKGEYIGEEYTLALAVNYRLPQKKGSVVANISTSRMIDDIAARHGTEVVRVPVGEVNVSRTMKKIGSVIGGEGNGGVIEPRVQYCRDSLTAISLILQHMAESGKTLSQIKAEFPSYHMIKEKMQCPQKFVQGLMDNLKKANKNAQLNLIDGLRIDWDDAWVHVRGSNTEPIVRVIAEARTADKAKGLVSQFKKDVQTYISGLK